MLFAYREIDAELAEVVLKYFYEHALRWLSPTNVSLSVFVEVQFYSVEAVALGSLPTFVDSRSLLKDRIIYP